MCKLTDFSPEQLIKVAALVDIEMKRLQSAIDVLYSFESEVLKFELIEEREKEIDDLRQWAAQLKEAYMAVRKREIVQSN